VSDDTPLTMLSAGLRLEARLRLPRAAAKGVCVVAHPHPQFGGDMHNNVVLVLCRAVTARGLAAVRFNFRGVGASEGKSEGGAAEIEDMQNVAQSLAERSELANLPLLLAGYSFGAWAAWHAAPKIARLAGLIVVSPPVCLMKHDFSLNRAIPILFVAGDHDTFCSPKRLTRALTDAGRGEIPRFIAGADHFWWGKENELEVMAGEFLSELLSAQ